MRWHTLNPSDWSLLCEIIIMQESWNKLNCIAGWCSSPLKWPDFTLFFRKISSQASIWVDSLWGCLFFAVCCTLQTPNRCLLDLVGVDPTPAGRVDGWPTIGLFLSFFLSLPPFWGGGQRQQLAWLVQGTAGRLVPSWAAAEGAVITAMSLWAPQQDGVAGLLITVVKFHL